MMTRACYWTTCSWSHVGVDGNLSTGCIRNGHSTFRHWFCSFSSKIPITSPAARDNYLKYCDCISNMSMWAATFYACWNPWEKKFSTVPPLFSMLSLLLVNLSNGQFSCLLYYMLYVTSWFLSLLTGCYIHMI